MLLILPLNQLHGSSADCNIKNYTPGSYLYSFSFCTLQIHSSITLHWLQSLACAGCFCSCCRAAFSGEGRPCECAERVWLPALHQTCAHTHSTLHRAAEKPFAGGGFNSLRSLLPGISCNVWSLKPNPSSKQLCECQHQEVF